MNLKTMETCEDNFKINTRLKKDEHLLPTSSPFRPLVGHKVRLSTVRPSQHQGRAECWVWVALLLLLWGT